MSTNYEIWLTTDAGVRLASLSTLTSLEASKEANKIGSFSIDMPLSFNPDLLAPDRMVQIWRQPKGGQLGLWHVYFIRRWKFSTSRASDNVTIGGPDINDLLRRRIVAAYSGSSQASKTNYADDMMKEIVSEANSDSADPTPIAGTRVWSDFSVAPDLSNGPTITRGIAWKYLLTESGQGALSTIAKATKEEDGTDLFFAVVPDVVGSNSISFRFETYTGQIGQDVSNRVVFDQARGNMRNPSLEYDYTSEVNYVYAGGQKQGAERNIQQVYDSDRYKQSKWGRIEGFANATGQSTDNGVISAGQDALNNGRPKVRFTAIPVDTEGTRFGIDWDFGYRVKAKYRNREFSSIINAVALSVDNSGKDTPQARLDYSE